MLVVHGTKKFLDRVGRPEAEPAESTTALGEWYATVLFWKPQVALFVNEPTLLPVLMPLAPARTLLCRLPDCVKLALSFQALSGSFIGTEVDEMTQTTLAKTANRSLIGMLNEFAFLAEQWRPATGTLLDLSLRLSDVPCGPLFRTHTTPRRAVAAAVDEWILVIESPDRRAGVSTRQRHERRKQAQRCPATTHSAVSAARRAFRDSLWGRRGIPTAPRSSDDV